MHVGPPIARGEAAGIGVAPLDRVLAVVAHLDIVGGPAIGHGPAEIARRGGEIGEGIAEQVTEIADALLELVGLQERQAVLRDEDAAGRSAGGNRYRTPS